MAGRDASAGRAGIVAAAVRLLGSAELPQLLGFLSYRAVATRAHVRPGTVEYHFGSKRELDLATVQAAASHYGAVDHQPLHDALAELGAGRGDLAGLAAAMGHQLQRVSPAGPREAELAGAGMAVLLMVAASTNDPEAAAVLRSEEALVLSSYARLVEAIRAATGRSWRAGYDAARLAQLTQTLVMGFAVVRRFDADSAPVGLFADAWLRLYLATTRDLGDNEPDPVIRASARFGVPGPDDAATRAALVEATQQVYTEHGWLGLTGAAVAARAGLPVVELMRLVGDRRGLAAAVWSGRVPRLERTLAHLDAAPSLETVVRGYLDELVSTLREDVALSAAFLEGLWTARTHGDSAAADPQSLVPLAELLTPLVASRAEQLDTPDLEPGDVAELLVGHALQLAATRPAWEPARVVDVVLATTYAGMRQPTTP